MGPNTLNSRDGETYWWKSEEPEISHSIFDYVKFLETNQAEDIESAKRHMKLYGGSPMFDQYSESTFNLRRDRLKLNIIKSICDTVTAKIAKNKVKPTFLTSGGDWSLQRKAKKLEKFSMGQLFATDFWEKAPITFLESCVFGTGALKIYRIGSEICMDRVMGPLELRVDAADGWYGDPRSLFQVKYINREVLLGMYPEKTNEILQAALSSHYDDQVYIANGTKTDLVKVIEAWHLKSGLNATDGLHCISIENASLITENYEKDYFPFAFIDWTKSMNGFWGIGLAEILTGIQIEINKILKENQMIFHLLDVPQIWLEDGTNIVSTHLDNQIGSVHKFSGSPPVQMTNGKVSQERIQYLLTLIDWAYELAGVSKLAAQAKKPEGLDSGKALRTFHDIETERFATVARSWENFTISVVKQLLDLAREIDEKEEGGYQVLVGNNKYAEKIKWKEINLKEDSYILQVFPTSLLPEEPAGRLQQVQEMMAAGLYGPEEGRRLLDFPDVESVNSLLNADLDDINMIIEHFIDKGEYIPPEIFQNLELGIQTMQRAYLKAKLDKVPPERLQLFLNWIEQAKDLLTPPPPPLAPGAPGEPLPGPVPDSANMAVPGDMPMTPEPAPPIPPTGALPLPPQTTIQ